MRCRSTAMSLIPIAVAVLVAYGIINWAVNLRYHVNEAKRSGLPYVVTRAFLPSSRFRGMSRTCADFGIVRIEACSPFWLPWQVSHKLWVPIIKLFPKSWWDGWLEYG